MAKKIYLFDSFGGDFYSCMFEGLDEDGCPRLTNMTPGQPIENFLDLLKINGDDILNYQLLCEEGKPADSKMVVTMLGQIFLDGISSYDRMTNRLEEMRKYSISYDQEQQTIKVRILDFEDEETSSMKYNLLMYAGNHYIGSGDGLFDNLKDICSKLSGFFFFIENQTHIPLKKHLLTTERVEKQVKRIAPNLFDNY